MGQRATRCNHLIKRIQNGDEKALENLFKEFGPYFLSVAKFYLVDKDWAEDLLSEVFVDIVKSTAQTFDENKNGLNWIYTAIKRKAYRHNGKTANESAYGEVENSHNLALCMANENVEVIAIKTALEKLTDEENNVLYLKFWDGLTVREIAKELDKSKSSVQYIINGAIKKIKVFLEDGENDEE